MGNIIIEAITNVFGNLFKKAGEFVGIQFRKPAPVKVEARDRYRR